MLEGYAAPLALMRNWQMCPYSVSIGYKEAVDHWWKPMLLYLIRGSTFSTTPFSSDVDKQIPLHTLQANHIQTPSYIITQFWKQSIPGTAGVVAQVLFQFDQRYH